MTAQERARKQQRIDYLKRVDPKSPEIKQLQKEIAAADKEAAAAAAKAPAPAPAPTAAAPQPAKATTPSPAPTTTALATAAATSPAQQTAQFTLGKDEASLMSQRENTLKEIKDRGGKESAPAYAARLEQIDNALSAIRKTQTPAPTAPAPVPTTSPTPGSLIPGYTDARSANTPANTPPLPGQSPSPSPAPLPPTVTIDNQPPAPPVVDPGSVKNNGTIDPVKASQDVNQGEQNDVTTNFNLEHPQRITDQYGNTRIITRHADGTVTVEDELGGTAKTFRDLATAAAESFNGTADRQRAEEATYGTLTKYYDRDKARELEAAKQELANRGIPYDPAAAQDPNTTNRYGRVIGGIDQKYQGYKDDASRQAVLAGNQAYATDSAARDSFLQAVTNGATTFGGNFGPYQNTVQTDTSKIAEDIIALSSDAFLKKYGIDKDTASKKYAVDHQKTGGSSGGSSNSGGFEVAT